MSITLILYITSADKDAQPHFRIVLNLRPGEFWRQSKRDRNPPVDGFWQLAKVQLCRRGSHVYALAVDARNILLFRKRSSDACLHCDKNQCHFYGCHFLFGSLSTKCVCVCVCVTVLRMPAHAQAIKDKRSANMSWVSNFSTRSLFS